MNNYYFWYRQTIPAGGSWVISGPYNDEGLAKRIRQTSKLDGDVGVVFSASSRDEAEKMTVYQ